MADMTREIRSRQYKNINTVTLDFKKIKIDKILTKEKLKQPCPSKRRHLKPKHLGS